jgi:predicted secreted protein
MQQDLLSISMSTTVGGADANGANAAQASAGRRAGPSQTGRCPDNGCAHRQLQPYPRYAKEGKINGWQGTVELVLEGTFASRPLPRSSR